MENIYSISIRRPTEAVIAALADIAAAIDSEPQQVSGPIDVTAEDIAILAAAGCIVTCPTCDGYGELSYLVDVDEANVFTCPTCSGMGEIKADEVIDAPSEDDAVNALP